MSIKKIDKESFVRAQLDKRVSKEKVSTVNIKLFDGNNKDDYESF